MNAVENIHNIEFLANQMFVEQDAMAKNMLISKYRHEKNILKLKLRESTNE